MREDVTGPDNAYHKKVKYDYLKYNYLKYDYTKYDYVK
jgi:hypothetical protein